MRNRMAAAAPVWAVAIGLSLSSAGCSYLFVQPPRDEGRPAGCTTSYLAPGVDTVLVGTNLASVFYVAAQPNVTNKGEAMAVGTAVAAFWLSSAIYGYHNVGACIDANDDERPYYPPPRPRPSWSPPPQAAASPPRFAPPGPPPAPASAPGAASQADDDDDPHPTRDPPSARARPVGKLDTPRFGE
jgi:hypothetical protein